MSIEPLKIEIRENAEEEAKHIIDNAKEERKKILNQTEDQVKHIIERRIQETSKKLAEQEKIELSLARIEGRRKILNIKSKYLNDAFVETENRLKELPEKNPKFYKDILVSYIKEAINSLNGNKFFIEVNQHDQQIVGETIEIIKKSLKKSNKNVELYISPTQISTIGGTIVQTDDNKQYFINTFESRLTKIKTENQGKVLEILSKSK
jgi:vacuolar-type H+-ATPase subunit E/Vma4